MTRKTRYCAMLHELSAEGLAVLLDTEPPIWRRLVRDELRRRVALVCGSKFLAGGTND